MPGGCVTGSLPQLKNSGKPPSSNAPLKPAGIPAEGTGTADGVGARGAWIAKGGAGVVRTAEGVGGRGLDGRGRGQEGHGLQGAWAGGSDSRGRGPAGYRQQGTCAGGARAARDVHWRGMSCRRLGGGWARAARGVGRRGADPTDGNLF